MAHNTARGGAGTLHRVVGERHQEALYGGFGLESVSLRTGPTGASNWQDLETGSRVQLVPRPKSNSWMMQFKELEGWPLRLQLVPGVRYCSERLRVVVDIREASIATRDRMQPLGAVPVKALCQVAQRMEPVDYAPSSTLGQAMRVEHSIRQTPEGLTRPSIATAAQVLLQKSIDASRQNPNAGFVEIERAREFTGIAEGDWTVRSQAWMQALECRLELETVTTDRLVIDPQADVLVTLKFPGSERWETLDGPVIDDALAVLIEGNDALVMMESVPAGFTHLDKHGLGRLQEILDYAVVTPIAPEG